MIKIYPSSFAEPKGATTNSTYSNGCPTYEVFKNDLPKRGNIHPLYSAIGTIGEEYHIARLGTVKETEISVKYELTPGIIISGRYDGICDDFIYEFKTSLSKAVYTSVINNGQVKIEHLGQLITYMCILKRPKGKLCVAYAHFDKKVTALKFETRDFVIEIRNDEIFIDNEKTEYTASGLMKFYSIVASAHSSESFPPMTSNDKACLYCPLQDLCAFGPRTKEEYRKKVTEIELVSSREFNPKIQIHDTRPKKTPKV